MKKHFVSGDTHVIKIQ